MEERIRAHVREIDRCNQRGGRMLSVTDLLEAGTLDRQMAGYLLGAISQGKSFLVGAKPGGAGKTTVMAALLNFIPDVDIVPVRGRAVIEKLRTGPPRCFLAHEIGQGMWYAYIWGADVDAFLRLADDHIVVSNLHADVIEDVLSVPGINEENLSKIHLLLFLRVDREKERTCRRIGAVYENQGGTNRAGFAPIYVWDSKRRKFEEVGTSRLVGPDRFERSLAIIDEIVEEGMHSVEEVRTMVLRSLHGGRGQGV